MSNQNPSANPQVQNPELAFGDLAKFIQALTEAVLAGETEVPVVHFKIAGRHIDFGPAPLKIS